MGGGELVCADKRYAGTVSECTGDQPTSLLPLPLPLGAVASRVIVVPKRLAHSLKPGDLSDGHTGHPGQQRSMS